MFLSLNLSPSRDPPETSGLDGVALELLLVLGDALPPVGAAAPVGARHHAAAQIAHLETDRQQGWDSMARR